VNKQQGQFYLFRQRRFLPFFITQFLGALNDNLFKNALLVIIVSSGISASDSNTNFLTNLAAGLFILPFFLFSTTAGQLADKYDKAWLIRRIKFAEILIMLTGSYALYSSNITLMLGVLFLLGVQSAFFGPIKYSIIPQHLAAEELMAGNAQVGMGTFTSILIGTLMGAWLVSYEGGELLVGSAAIMLALIGWRASCAIPDAPSEGGDVPISLNPIADAAGNIRLARENMTVLLHYGHLLVLVIWRQLFNSGTEFCCDRAPGSCQFNIGTFRRLYCGGSDWLTALCQNIRSPG